MGRAVAFRGRLKRNGGGAHGGGPGRAAPGSLLNPNVKRRWLRFILPCTFLVFWLLNLAVGFDWRTVGLAARIYYHGSAAWLAGQDPWSTRAYLGDRLFSYAGLPPTAILLAPLALLPEELFVWLWLLLSVVAAVDVVRRLKLPLVWFAYPPLLTGSSRRTRTSSSWHSWSRAGREGVVATMLKVVAIPPLIGERRLRALGLAAFLFVGTALLAQGLWASSFTRRGWWRTKSMPSRVGAPVHETTPCCSSRLSSRLACWP